MRKLRRKLECWRLFQTWKSHPSCWTRKEIKTLPSMIKTTRNWAATLKVWLRGHKISNYLKNILIIRKEASVKSQWVIFMKWNGQLSSRHTTPSLATICFCGMDLESPTLWVSSRRAWGLHLLKHQFQATCLVKVSTWPIWLRKVSIIADRAHPQKH